MGLKPLVNANDFEIRSSRLSEKFTKDLSRQDSPSKMKIRWQSWVQGKASGYYRRFRRSRVCDGMTTFRGRLPGSPAMHKRRAGTSQGDRLPSWEVDLSDEDHFETVCQNVMDTLGTAGIIVN